MNPESCPKRDICLKIKRSRLTGGCLCCSGIEPVEYNCARCEEKDKTRERKPILVA